MWGIGCTRRALNYRIDKMIVLHFASPDKLPVKVNSIFPMDIQFTGKSEPSLPCRKLPMDWSKKGLVAGGS